MKIAIVLNTSWNIYNFRLNLVKAFLEQGHTVYAIAPRDAYSGKLKDAGCQFVPIKLDSRGANPVKDLGLTFELFWIYRKVKPDVVLHYTIKPNIYGTLAASFLRIPTINNVCGLGTVFLQQNWVSRIAKFMYKLAFRFPRKIFFQNQHDLDLFLNMKLVSPGVTDLIPGSGVDLSRFQPRKSKEGKRPFTFLAISRLIYDKGIVELVEAIRQLKEEGVDARFQILGPVDAGHSRGIPEATIQQWVEEKIFEYLGSTDDVREFIHQADCVVLPSYREGTPRTLLEAASSGKPLVATNVPGCNSVVADRENGLLCKPRDADDLAKKMKAMVIMDPEQRLKMGQRSRERMEHLFDERLVVDKYLSEIAAL